MGPPVPEEERSLMFDFVIVGVVFLTISLEILTVEEE
jgi:hypothetical protein